MTDEQKRIVDKLNELLSAESGYFGRIDTWGQRPNKYERVGYVLSKPFDETLVKMSLNQRKKLVRILFYFEIHARPLGKLLEVEEGKSPDLFSDMAWSHFMTVIMFGMLEVAVRDTEWAIYNDRWHLKKGESIENFLVAHLPEKTKTHIADKYKVEGGTAPLTEKSFSGVIRHLWQEIRSGFVHEGNIQNKGLEWYRLSGMGSKEDPMTIASDIPMQELLQITWQAILHSFGYKGSLELPKYER